MKINCSFYFIFLNLFSSSNIVLLKIWLVVEMELFFCFIDVDVFFFEGVMNCINN